MILNKCEWSLYKGFRPATWRCILFMESLLHEGDGDGDKEGDRE